MFKKYTLKNGVRLIIAPRTETKAVAVMVGVAAGSRYESDAIAGISHFSEHMFFKGSKKRPTPKMVNDFINDIGGMYNAYTDKELTAYHVKIASDHLLEVFDYLSDNLINPLNLQEEFDREKGVVIEDIKMHKDRPMEEVFELFEEAIFTEKDLGRRIAGTVASVEKISLANLKKYEDTRYIAENVVIVVSGNLGKLNEVEVVEEAEKFFQVRNGERGLVNPSNTLEKSRIITDKRQTEQTNVIVGFGGPSLKNEEDKYAVRFMAGILGGSSSSRMFAEVREKSGLAYAMETDYQGYLDTGSILTLANVANENVEKATRAIIEVYKDFVENGPTEEEMSRVKEITKSSFLIELEDSENLAEMLMRMELAHEKLVNPDEILQSYLDVTISDIKRVARKYLNFDKMLISAVGPEIDEQKLNQILMG